MLCYIVTFLGILLYTYMLGMLIKRNIITGFILGTTVFLLIYVISSGFLLWINIFSVIKGCFITAAFGIIVDVFLYQKRHNTFTLISTSKKELIPFCVIICMLPYMLNQFDVFGMGLLMARRLVPSFTVWHKQPS